MAIQSPHFECQTYVCLDFIRVSSSPSSVRLNTFSTVDWVATVLAELDVDLEVDDRGWKIKTLSLELKISVSDFPTVFNSDQPKTGLN